MQFPINLRTMALASVRESVKDLANESFNHSPHDTGGDLVNDSHQPLDKQQAQASIEQLVKEAIREAVKETVRETVKETLKDTLEDTTNAAFKHLLKEQFQGALNEMSFVEKSLEKSSVDEFRRDEPGQVRSRQDQPGYDEQRQNQYGQDQSSQSATRSYLCTSAQQVEARYVEEFRRMSKRADILPLVSLAETNCFDVAQQVIEPIQSKAQPAVVAKPSAVVQPHAVAQFQARLQSSSKAQAQVDLQSQANRSAFSAKPQSQADRSVYAKTRCHADTVQELPAAIYRKSDSSSRRFKQEGVKELRRNQTVRDLALRPVYILLIRWFRKNSNKSAKDFLAELRFVIHKLSLHQM